MITWNISPAPSQSLAVMMGVCFRNLQVVMDANALTNYKEVAGQNVGAWNISPAPSQSLAVMMGVWT